MWFEDLMLIALLGVGVFLIGIPCYKLITSILPKKRNALKEAKERLEQARLDLEAARLNKEAEKLNERIYEEALQEEQALEEELNEQQEKHK